MGMTLGLAASGSRGSVLPGAGELTSCCRRCSGTGSVWAGTSSQGNTCPLFSPTKKNVLGFGGRFCSDLHLSRSCFSFVFIYDFLQNSEKKAQKQFGRKVREKNLAEPCTSSPKNRCLTLKITPFISRHSGLWIGALLNTIWSRLLISEFNLSYSSSFSGSFV